MRVLKFRAWDKSHKKMLDRVLAGPGDPCSIVWDDERKEWLNFDEFCGDIMQYTGLKDRNGREIFDGDILKMQDATAKVVFWGKPPEFGLDYYHNEGEWCEDWNLSDDSTRMEIIGNIYEHPELMSHA